MSWAGSAAGSPDGGPWPSRRHAAYRLTGFAYPRRLAEGGADLGVWDFRQLSPRAQFPRVVDGYPRVMEVAPRTRDQRIRTWTMGKRLPPWVPIPKACLAEMSEYSLLLGSMETLACGSLSPNSCFAGSPLECARSQGSGGTTGAS